MFFPISLIIRSQSVYLEVCRHVLDFTLRTYAHNCAQNCNNLHIKRSKRLHAKTFVSNVLAVRLWRRKCGDSETRSLPGLLMKQCSWPMVRGSAGSRRSHLFIPQSPAAATCTLPATINLPSTVYWKHGRILEWRLTCDTLLQTLFLKLIKMAVIFIKFFGKYPFHLN